MGFFKTLLTGVRDDELNEDEREQFQEFQRNGLENVSTLDIDLVLNYIQNYASNNDLAKIQNAIAIKEDGVDEIPDKITQEEVSETLSESDTVEVSNDLEEVDSQDIIELDDSDEINERVDEESKKEIDSELELEDSSDDEEYVDLDGDEYSDDLEEDSFDDPTLFSVVHDELMELFKEGQIILLKEEFRFPTLGKRETLAFGIFNSEVSDIKEQTHWFVQNLKQFSRLKECKMLLSEDNEKDLILEVGDKHAILLCFKTNNLIGNEFEFNRKWN